jgi:hypothetical protein
MGGWSRIAGRIAAVLRQPAGRKSWYLHMRCQHSTHLVLKGAAGCGQRVLHQCSVHSGLRVRRGLAGLQLLRAWCVGLDGLQAGRRRT